MKPKPSLLVVIVLILISSCQHKSRDQDESVAGKLILNELNGNSIDLAQFKGKTVFVNVWATWCKPCIEEMPSIKQAQSVLAGKKIEFLLASNEEKERIEAFASKRQLDLHYVQLKNLEELAIPALPVTYIINSKGETVFSEAGYRKWDDIANIELLTKIIEDNE